MGDRWAGGRCRAGWWRMWGAVAVPCRAAWGGPGRPYRLRSDEHLVAPIGGVAVEDMEAGQPAGVHRVIRSGAWRVSVKFRLGKIPLFPVDTGADYGDDPRADSSDEDDNCGDHDGGHVFPLTFLPGVRVPPTPGLVLSTPRGTDPSPCQISSLNVSQIGTPQMPWRIIFVASMGGCSRA